MKLHELGNRLSIPCVLVYFAMVWIAQVLAGTHHSRYVQRALQMLRVVEESHSIGAGRWWVPPKRAAER